MDKIYIDDSVRRYILDVRFLEMGYHGSRLDFRNRGPGYVDYDYVPSKSLFLWIISLNRLTLYAYNVNLSDYIWEPDDGVQDTEYHVRIRQNADWVAFVCFLYLD